MLYFRLGGSGGQKVKSKKIKNKREDISMKKTKKIIIDIAWFSMISYLIFVAMHHG